MSIADTASRLLAVNGEPVQFSYKSGGSYDPAAGGIIGEVTSFIDGNGYPSGYSNTETNGTAIEAGDIRLICEKLATRPAQGWQCLVDEQDYRVMDVKPIRKSGVDIIYICQLRK
jgi:hypothetical protein